MKAAVFYGVGDLRIEERKEPYPKRGELLVKVMTALTCGTDLKTYRRGHSLVKPPIVIGHEFSGVVEAVGEGIKGFRVGDRVAAANSAPCGSCFYCKKGDENLCERLEDHIIGFTQDGAYAEYVIVPQRIVEKNTYALPDDVSYEQAAILEPLACVVNGNEAASIGLGDSVVIIGSGPIGLLHLQVSRLRGAGEIIVLDASKDRLKKAKELGADHTVEVGIDGGVGDVLSLTDRRGADVVIEAVGRLEAWEAAMKMCRKGGRVIFFGGCPAGTQLSVDTHALHYGGLTLKGVFHHTPNTVYKAYNLIIKKKVDAKSIITDRMSLEELPKAFESIASGKSLKVAIRIAGP
ncbi:MAG: alcohol dehydrogenase catalytic domain-containing protein [Nitrososphaerota archaeon]